MKYELIKTPEMYQIRALKTFANVKAGDLGGYVESEHNLSQEGDCGTIEEFEKAVFDNYGGDHPYHDVIKWQRNSK